MSLRPVTSRLTNVITAWQYRPGGQPPPAGIKPLSMGYPLCTSTAVAHTTLPMPSVELTLRRRDGVTLTVMPMDWVLQVDDGEYIVLDDCAFHALFTLTCEAPYAGVE